MRKKIAGIVVFYFFVASVYAQDKIKTDRPGESQTPEILTKKWFQAEIGLQFENDELKSISHPDLLLKYGLSKRIELRLITEVITEETLAVIPSGNNFVSGVLPIRLGTKIALWDEKGGLPKTSLLIHTSIPKFASEKFRQRKWVPDFRLAMLNSLSDKVDLN